MSVIIRNLILILCLSLIVKYSIACDYPVTVETSTNCKGVLLSEKQFIEASNNKALIRKKDLQIAHLKTLDSLHIQRHEVYKERLREANKELKWHEFKTGVGYVVSFSFGAILTGYIAKEVLK